MGAAERILELEEELRTAQYNKSFKKRFGRKQGGLKPTSQ